MVAGALATLPHGGDRARPQMRSCLSIVDAAKNFNIGKSRKIAKLPFSEQVAVFRQLDQVHHNGQRPQPPQ
jgi:hypothetical protein